MLRACQQINENSKELAFFNVIPEMNHNEIVGWAEKPKNISVVMLRSDLENSRNSKRLDITHEIILRKNAVLEVKAKGNNFIEQAFYLIHLVDWLSLLKAEKKSIDVIEVDVIDYLKNELSK
jgi:glucose/mannose-6-phosphate isomerase